jgi:hypothetical protein
MAIYTVKPSHLLAYGDRQRTIANRVAGGEGGIRTPDTVARMPHFECGAFNHSATSPTY